MMSSCSPIRNHDGRSFHSGWSPDSSVSASWRGGALRYGHQCGLRRGYVLAEDVVEAVRSDVKVGRSVAARHRPRRLLAEHAAREHTRELEAVLTGLRGVSLPAGVWLEMTGLILVGLLPFAALGVLLGHLLTADVIGPATGGVVSLLALVSGTGFPLAEDGFLQDIAQFLPSYWLVQASHVSFGGHGWTATGWTVIAAWTFALAVLARAAYHRDTERV